MRNIKISILNTINNLTSAINNLAQSIRFSSNIKVSPSPKTITSNPANVSVKYYPVEKQEDKNGYISKAQKRYDSTDVNSGNLTSLSIVQRQSLYRVFKAMDNPDMSSLNYMKIHWPQMYNALESLRKPSYDPGHVWKSKFDK